MNNSVKNNMTDENKWADLHIHLQDLLAGYVDDELNQQEKSNIEAHLAGCESCRADVARQQLISQRLNKLPLERLSPDAHQRIDDVLDNALSETLSSSNNVKHQSQTAPILVNGFQRIYQQLYKPSFIAASGWSVALLLIVVLLYPSLTPKSSHNVPMVEDVLTEYLQLDKTSLPASNSDSTPSLPANWPNARLLSSWDTTIGGAPAKAYAMRSGDNIIVQYRVDETVFFRNPSVRQAVADSGNYLSQQNNIQVLAMPLKDAGLLVVGPADWMPSPEKITLIKT